MPINNITACFNFVFDGVEKLSRLAVMDNVRPGAFGDKTDLVFIDHPALKLIVPAMVARALYDYLIDRQMIQARGLY